MLRTISLSVLLLSSHLADANQGALDNEIEAVIQMFSQSGQLSNSAECMGIKSSVLEQTMRKSLSSCIEQMGWQDSDDFDQCILAEASQSLGIPAKRITDCDLVDSNPTESPLEHRINQIETKIIAAEQAIEVLYQKDQLTAAQQQRYDELEAEIQTLSEQLMTLTEQQLNDPEFAATMMNAFAGTSLSKASSHSSTASITLPIYSNSQMVMHLTPEQLPAQFAGALPAATFASQDQLNQVVSYYQKALSQFNYQLLDSGEHLFMPQMPPDFDFLKDMQLYMTKPHVLIRAVDNQTPLAPGAQTFIEIAYLPE